jgi:hypothetical protein
MLFANSLAQRLRCAAESWRCRLDRPPIPARYSHPLAHRIVARCSMMRGNQGENAYCLSGECSSDTERCLTAGVPVASLISRPSNSSPFLNSKLMLTDVGPVELWATRQRRPSAAANPQGVVAGSTWLCIGSVVRAHCGLRLGCLQKLTFGHRVRAAHTIIPHS